jgi:hypothetical protein
LFKQGISGFRKSVEKRNDFDLPDLVGYRSIKASKKNNKNHHHYTDNKDDKEH